MPITTTKNTKTSPPATSRQNVFLQQLVVLLVPATLLYVAVTVFLATVLTAQLQQTIENHQKENITNRAKAILENIQQVTKDVYLLSEHAAFDIYNNQSDRKKAVQELTREFLAYAHTHRQFDQIRFIDRNGMEIVRINSPQGNPAVPASQLQDKSSRYYFQETIGLKKSQIYLSPLDLNVERGAIEMPLNPTLRIATPVIGPQGKTIGIVILNYRALSLLSDFANAVSDITGDTVLLNKDGYYLYSRDSSLSWGFLLDHRASFKASNPEMWERINTARNGQIYKENGLYTFMTIHPKEKARLTKEGLPFPPPYTNAAKDNYHWYAVAYLPLSEIESQRSQLLKNMTLIFLPIYLCLVAGTLIIAAYKTQSWQKS